MLKPLDWLIARYVEWSDEAFYQEQLRKGKVDKTERHVHDYNVRVKKAAKAAKQAARDQAFRDGTWRKKE